MGRDPDKYRAYMNDYMQRRWQERRAVAIRFLGGMCKWCGSTEKLQFDHIDFRTKRHTVSKFTSLNEVAFWEEVKKCQLLCEGCHKTKSSPELSILAKAREAKKRVRNSIR